MKTLDLKKSSTIISNADLPTRSIVNVASAKQKILGIVYVSTFA